MQRLKAREISNFNSALRSPSTTDNGTPLSAFQFAPQLSYGLVDTVDLQIRPNYNGAFSTGADRQRASAFGDVFCGVKWRFFEYGNWTRAVGVGSGFPTGNAARGLDAGQATPFAYLIGRWTTEILQVQSALGRAWLAHVSAAALSNRSPDCGSASTSSRIKTRSGRPGSGPPRRLRGCSTASRPFWISIWAINVA